MNNPNEECYMTLDADNGFIWNDYSGASFSMTDDGNGGINISNTLATQSSPIGQFPPIFHIFQGPVNFEVSDLLLNGMSMTDPTQGGYVLVPNPPQDGSTHTLQTDGNGNIFWA